SDRLTRRVSHSYAVIGQAEKHGVALVSVTERDLDLSTATGRAFAGLLQIFAATDEDEKRRLLAASYGQIRIKKGVRGRRGFDEGRVVLLGAEDGGERGCARGSRGEAAL